jgi:thiamine biosynthesis lipoprotein
MTGERLYKAQSRFLFHSRIRLKIPARYGEEDFDAFYRVLETIDKRYNSFQPGSFFDKINRRAGEFVPVDAESIGMIARATAISDLVDGAYDISIMPLLRLWGFWQTRQTLPTPEDIAAARSRVNYRQIQTRGHAVCIGKTQEIITGSFLKAYAVDRLADKLRESGIHDAIINAGSSTICAINCAENPYSEVSVHEPESDKHLFTLKIANQCYATSAQTKTAVHIDGKSYGHILDPRTGFPSGNRLLGIISRNGMTGDMLSTALYNETPTGFLDKISRLPADWQITGFLMDAHGNLTFSPGFAAQLL